MPQALAKKLCGELLGMGPDCTICALSPTTTSTASITPERGRRCRRHCPNMPRGVPAGRIPRDSAAVCDRSHHRGEGPYDSPPSEEQKSSALPHAILCYARRLDRLCRYSRPRPARPNPRWCRRPGSHQWGAGGHGSDSCSGAIAVT
ncbi:MAG: hypothetical protein MZV70_05280 [Desulfobacterales bacterium]|nr:hypothetical protein [Desulfobacterales bacterium]